MTPKITLSWIASEAITIISNATGEDYGGATVTDGYNTYVQVKRSCGDPAKRLIFSWPYGYDMTNDRALELIEGILEYISPAFWEYQQEQMLQARMETYKYIAFNAAAADFARSHPI